MEGSERRKRPKWDVPAEAPPTHINPVVAAAQAAAAAANRPPVQPGTKLSGFVAAGTPVPPKPAPSAAPPAAHVPMSEEAVQRARDVAASLAAKLVQVRGGGCVAGRRGCRGCVSVCLHASASARAYGHAHGLAYTHARTHTTPPGPPPNGRRRPRAPTCRQVEGAAVASRSSSRSGRW